MNEVILGTACGVLFGPYGANVLNPRAWGDVNAVTLEVMRITLAMGLFTIGVELPQSYLAENARGLLVMVVPAIAFGWITVACATYLTFVRLDFISSLVIAACLTPTDPIISAAIVAESASNDGLAYPFLSLSIYLTTRTSTGIALRDWILVGCLYQVVLGTAIGAVLGLTFSYLMKLSYRKGFVNRESYLVQHLALTLFTIGITRTLGCDDLLAVFAAGCALNWNGYSHAQVEGEVFSAVIDLVLNCGTFVYIGAWMPFASYDSPELGITPWRLVLLLLAVLCLRRIPALLFLYRWIPEIATWKEALFTGHFGSVRRT
ncbi:Sodium/hydrogen exchanger [Lentinus brumalis]|uniref:Sodium/hydrogen exchanger n=1 Tax=Lentinus brumalis TaxID=2498619 RepID=A0A371D6B3_9APHY|nr:Sodium/hydrogen exchanger [Polyporus brumalis]